MVTEVRTPNVPKEGQSTKEPGVTYCPCLQLEKRHVQNSAQPSTAINPDLPRQEADGAAPSLSSNSTDCVRHCSAAPTSGEGVVTLEVPLL